MLMASWWPQGPGPGQNAWAYVAETARLQSLAMGREHLYLGMDWHIGGQAVVQCECVPCQGVFKRSAPFAAR
jgi:hypothetical protein